MLSILVVWLSSSLSSFSLPSVINSTLTTNLPVSKMSIIEYVRNASTSLPTSILASDRVYKDDCMFTFDTAENSVNGLDVCMSCFQAFSRTEHRNWTSEHYSKKRHALYVNINKVLKPESERISPFSLDLDDKRLPKAPKLEIVQQTDLDLYDTTNTLYVAPIDDYLSFEDCSESVKSLADKILLANSANTDNDIQAWEHEVFACEHSSSLDQEYEKNIADISKCASCELIANLWVCLTCGAVSCGRAQFGTDIKGNSHALAHFELSGHAVAAKLGSLSADENKCDCYCYKCNDEVKVPGLGSSLRSFGIDLESVVKSEKSLVELNLETNKNWQFNLDGNDGEKLSPVFGPGLTGMKNLGNTCYINSIVQTLFSLSSYRKFFASKSFDDDVPDAAEDLTSQLLKLHDGLISGRYSKPSGLKGDQYQEGIKPESFKNLIGRDHPEFRTNKQQDANEFLLYLFDKLDREFGFSLNQEFKFLLANKLVCTKCHTGSITDELLDALSIPIKINVTGAEENGKKTYEPTTFEESLTTYTTPELIEGYMCEVCNERTEALKLTGFKTYPKFLLTSLQRIQLENWTPVKVEVPVEIPNNLDLAPFKAPVFAENEKPAPELSPLSQFKPNEEAMQTLQSMGFSDNRSTRALYNTENKGAEEAMNWIFAHMDDADIDSPFTYPDAESSAESGSEVLQEAIDNLVAMGFGANLARKALHLHLSDPNAAVEWLFSHPNDDGVIHKEKPKINIAEESKALKKRLAETENDSSKYRLKAVVCHKGSSPNTGHYVAFIRIDENWVLFNDEKVVDCANKVDEIRPCGYIYLFERY